jgi:UDP-N-acetylmuramoyl-tripeptide--D-alanyl-D-alanine ligase
MDMARKRGLSAINYPQKGDFVELELLPSDFFVKFKSPDSQAVHSQLFGDYNFMNIAAAICVGQYFDVPMEDCLTAVQDYQPQNMRSQILKKNGNTILLDAYNANPSSMEAAIQNFANIKSPSKILILGDMLELGELSTQEHQKLGELIAQYDFKTILLYGNEIQAALPKNPKAYYFNDKFSLHNWCKDHPFKDSYILIKGSRGVKLETVLDFI